MMGSVYLKKFKSQHSKVWKKFNSGLNNLDVELTERCNCDCIHCSINLPVSDREVRKRELSTDGVQRILSEAADMGCISVRFTGGEPLIRTDFKDLYLFARKKGLRVILFTNATLITSGLVNLFKKFPPGEKIEVSVYGMEQSSYEGVTRAPGSFAAARRGIDLLLKNKIPFVVKGALLPPNIREINEFDRWVKDFIPDTEDPPSQAVFFDLRWRHDSPSKDGAIRRLRLKPEDALRYISRHEPQYTNDLRMFCEQYAFPPGDKLFTCSAGKRQAAVDAYGNLQVCQPLRHPKTVYDLKTGSLKDGLKNFFPAVRELRAKNPDYLKRCATCFLKGLCEMCPGKSWAEHGTLDTPVEYLCEAAHTIARYLGYLSKTEFGWEVGDGKKRIRQVNAECLEE